MWDTILSVMEIIEEDIILYNNRSFLLPLFLIALLFLWIVEKDRKLRMVLVYLVAAIAVVFACPFYAWIGMKIDEEIYYRVLWTLPIGILVCYSMVKIIVQFKPVVVKLLLFVLAIVAIVLNGKLVYKNTLYFKATNTNNIPQMVMDVADAIRLENYKPVAVLPAELLPFLRQYTADIFTPYGRNILEPAWTFHSELYDAMEGDLTTYDVEEVARCARNEHCAFVVLSSNKRLKGSMEEQGYFRLDFVQGYYIYMDYNYYWVYKQQGLLDEDVITVGG